MHVSSLCWLPHWLKCADGYIWNSPPPTLSLVICQGKTFLSLGTSQEERELFATSKNALNLYSPIASTSRKMFALSYFIANPQHRYAKPSHQVWLGCSYKCWLSHPVILLISAFIFSLCPEEEIFPLHLTALCSCSELRVMVDQIQFKIQMSKCQEISVGVDDIQFEQVMRLLLTNMTALAS